MFLTLSEEVDAGNPYLSAYAFQPGVKALDLLTHLEPLRLLFLEVVFP
jgi:hypothetical protein